ncbi:MAG: hypothetical protein DRJ42_29375, partial [Deltaproteobacteria bacterium]
ADSVAAVRLGTLAFGYWLRAVGAWVRFSKWHAGREPKRYWAYLERGSWLTLLLAPALYFYAATAPLTALCIGGMILWAVLYSVVPFYSRWKVLLDRPGVLLLRRGSSRRRVAIRDVQGLAYDRWSGWLVLDDGERYPLADDLSAATIIGARAAG